MATLVQFNFDISVPADEYREIARSVASAFAAVPGLRWKVWFLDAPAGQAGGIYLFDDIAAVRAFLNSDLAAQVKSAPFHRGLDVKFAEVMDDVTAVTRGPVQPVAAA